MSRFFVNFLVLFTEVDFFFTNEMPVLGWDLIFSLQNLRLRCIWKFAPFWLQGVNNI